MLRRWAITLALMALPFVLYWLYRRLAERRRAGAGAPAKAPDWPRTILWLTGLVLALEALTLAVLSEPKQEGRYVPARVDAEGKLIPPHFEPPPPPSPPPQ